MKGEGGERIKVQHIRISTDCCKDSLNNSPIVVARIHFKLSHGGTLR